MDIILQDVAAWGCESCGMGMVSVFGSEAFTVLVSEYNSAFYPAVGASRYGDGRVVAFSHDTFLNPGNEIADSVKFLNNTIAWASNTDGSKSVGILSTGQPNYQELNAFLNANGYNSAIINYDALFNLSSTSFDVIIIASMLSIENNVVESMKNYVFRGGALVTGCTSWANPNVDFR